MSKSREQIIAGALYAFAARLTTGPNMQVGHSHVAGPMAEAVDAFCREVFGDKYGEPDVANWRETMRLLPPVVNDEPEPRLYGGGREGGKSYASILDVCEGAFPFFTAFDRCALSGEVATVIARGDGGIERAYCLTNGESVTFDMTFHDLTWADVLTFKGGVLYREVRHRGHVWSVAVNEPADKIGHRMAETMKRHLLATPGDRMAHIRSELETMRAQSRDEREAMKGILQSTAPNDGPKCDGEHTPYECASPGCWLK